MDARTRRRFARMWDEGVPLEEIARALKYSVSTLSKLRMAYGLRKRFGAEPDEGIPSPATIAERAAEVRARWTAEDYRHRRVGLGHTVYSAITVFPYEYKEKHLHRDDAV